MKTCGKALLFLLLAASASAQRFEAAGLFGYTTTSKVDEVAPGLRSLDVSGGFTWSGQFTYFLSPHLGVEVSWAQRKDPLTLSTSSGSAELFEIDSRQLLGSVVYRFGHESATLRPFVLGGLGATFFSAEEIPGETKLAWSVGGGVRTYPWRNFGIKAQAKFSLPDVPERRRVRVLRPLRFLLELDRALRAPGRRRLPVLIGGGSAGPKCRWSIRSRTVRYNSASYSEEE